MSERIRQKEVGVEISEQYFEIAKKRIHDAQQQMRMEFPDER